MAIYDLPEDQEWLQLASASFAQDWANDQDAIYDNWQKHYHVSELKLDQANER